MTDSQIAIFAYGSLCSVESMEESLGRRYDGPYVVCAIDGWRRGWDVAVPNTTFYADTPDGRLTPGRILYLNVRRQPRSTVVGALFVVEHSDLEAFDRRESEYERIDVSGDLRGVRLATGRAVTYVARPRHVVSHVDSPRDAAVRATYLRVLERAYRDLGAGFRARFDETTDPVPRDLVIEDLRDPGPPV